jgi:hypothetical protein
MIIALVATFSLRSVMYKNSFPRNSKTSLIGYKLHYLLCLEDEHNFP